MTGRLDGRRALITGGSSGIGAAAVAAFVREGATVVAAARDPQRGRAIEERHPGTVTFVQSDVSDPSAVASLVVRSVEVLGGIDILVNNAGAFPVGTLDQPDEEGFDLAFAVNVKGPYFLTAAAGRLMVAQGYGKVINISTMAASVGVPGIGVYSASKAALVSLTQTWAAELGPLGVNVNAIGPGPIPTPMTADIQDAQDEFASRLPARRKGTPEDIAGAILFLASAEAAYIHGEHLMVDGGYVAV
jgi:NAD(P)-dependent dehydrogenase (short-subunit alcohol dehydrogenase family)